MRTLLLLCLIACNQGPTENSAKESVDTRTGCDEDGDGYCPSEGDCLDADPNRYPGAPEVCDGLDNNCDGDVDEGKLSTFYQDDDQDGFGNIAVSTEACEAPDGYVIDHNDCDDTNYAIYPGAFEICNGQDDDCDTEVDEGYLQAWYQDADEDGFGDPGVALARCEQPDGYISDNTDCDDSTARVWPGNPEACDNLDNDCNGLVDDGVSTIWYADFDGDGIGTDLLTQQACVAPTGYVAPSGDCDDFVVTTYPGADEFCNGADDDCDGQVDESDALDVSRWYADVDGDGYGDPTAFQDRCDAPLAYVSDGTDCNDAVNAIHPGATEVCDGQDNDCDGSVDQNAVDASTFYIDLDGDSHGSYAVVVTACSAPAGYVSVGDDCNDATAESYPGATEVCDRLDNDCDGTIDQNAVDASLWYQDNDADGYGDAATMTLACSVPSGYAANDLDCDDGDLNVHPSAPEYCNSIDDNCDGTVDENAVDATRWYVDADGDSYGDVVSIYECTAPAGYVGNNMDCDDGNAQVYPSADEYCNGTDDDCDGKVDEGALDQVIWYLDADGDGRGLQTSPVFGCTAPTGYVAYDDDCDDSNSSISPVATEYCNSVDDDCDRQVDENTAADAGTWYLDADGDLYGNPNVSQVSCSQPAGWLSDATDCDDADANIHPGATESWYDGIDSDCDGNEDPDSCVEEPPAGTLTTDPNCIYTPPGTFNPTVEWSMSTFSTYANYKHVIMAPMIGQLTDDNRDGVLSDLDTPDVAFISFSRASGAGLDGVLRIVSGTGLVVHQSVSSKTYKGNSYAPYRYSNLALGDIDKDGTPEIVTTVYQASSGNCYTGAYDANGNLEWVYTGTTVRCSAHAPALADLEGDGDVEVVMGRLILNGNGTLQALGTGGYGYYSTYSNAGYMSFPVDLDGDGKMEVVAGSSVYKSDGSVKCSTGTTDGYPAAANLDSDSSGEFVVVAGGTIRVFDTNCSQLYSYSVYGGGYGGPPTIADYDGDGTPEIGLPGSTYYTVYEINGTRLWSMPITDASSHSTGSSVFDFDGDGAAEVVYADETMLWVFDGRTGKVDLQSSQHGSGTVNEYPVVADVDSDGNAEIIVPNDNTATGIMVLGDVNDAWVSARTVWNQHAYSIVNINDDLSIPTVAASNWPTYNNFRQGDVGGLAPGDAPNLSMDTWGTCQAACGNDVDVQVQVLNDGLVRADSTTALVIYGENSAGTRTELDRTTLGTALGAGARSSTYTFTFTAAEVLNYAKLVAAVDPDAISSECDETDNEVEVDTTGVCN